MKTSGILLRMEGPLRSWGEKSFGMNRETLKHPTQSAVLGLVGACVGINRHDVEQTDAWYRAWDIMTLTVQNHFKYLRDYQITQGVRIAKKGSIEENASVSHRYYLVGVVDYALLIPKAGSVWAEQLDDVIQALSFPVYTPFMGRKTNTLSAPLVIPQTAVTVTEPEQMATWMIEAAVAQGDLTPESQGSLLLSPMALDTPELTSVRQSMVSDNRNGHFMTYSDRDVHFYQVKSSGADQ